MSYRFNKDKRNSKNSSFNKRSSNFSQKENDSKKSNFNDRRRTNNRINRLSSDQVNQYSSDNEFSGRLRSSNQSNSNYRGSNRFERKSVKPSYRNQNSQETNNYRRAENKEPLSYSESFTKTLRDDLIWGRHSTEAALLSGRAIHRIWCTSELRSTPKFFQLLKDQKASGVLVEEVSWSRLGQLTNGAVHQGIVLQIAASKTLNLKN